MDYAALIQLAIGLYGEQKAKNMSKEQLALLKDQLDQMRAIPLPQLSEVNPEQLGQSEVGKLHPDEALRGHQLDMLSEMRNTIDQGGLSLSDRAAMADSLGEASAQARRGRSNVKADLARHGGLDSGAQLMASMQSASDNARDAGHAGLETAAMAERRKLDAMREYLSGTGALRGQDFGENVTAAGARDARAEGNAGRREKATYYNAGLPQQGFANAMSKATGQVPAGNNLAAAYGANAQGTRDFWGNMGAAAGAGARSNNSYTGSGSGGGRSTQKRDANGDPYESDPSEWENPWA